MSGEILISLARKEVGLTQAGLAKKMRVSTAQISKWKNDRMPYNRQKELEDLIGLGENEDAGLIYYAGSRQDADKWRDLLVDMADRILRDSVSPYECNILLMDFGQASFVGSVFYEMSKAGMKHPIPFPKELEVLNMNDRQGIEDAIEKNQVASAINYVLRTLDNLYGFFASYIEPIYDAIVEEDVEVKDSLGELEHQLLPLAIIKTTHINNVCVNLDCYAEDVLHSYKGLLRDLKSKAVEMGIPLQEEVMKILTWSREKADDLSDREACDFEEGLDEHPDYYMNQLLNGIKLNGAMLRALCEKMKVAQADIRKHLK